MWLYCLVPFGENARRYRYGILSQIAREKVVDREEIVRVVPTLNRFNDLGRALQKQAAEDFIAAILDAIARERRQPDEWEAYDLASALGYIACGMYHAGVALADRSLTPPDRRAPPEEQPQRAGQQATLQDLQRAHHHVALIPLRNT
jgi:hypothetical protein